MVQIRALDITFSLVGTKDFHCTTILILCGASSIKGLYLYTVNMRVSFRGTEP